MKLKKLLLLSLILLFFTISLYAQNSKTQAILKLNLQGHLASIKDAIFTPSGDIISIGSDKTIYIWDKYGNQKKKILAFSENNKVDEINSIAISPDEKYLAINIESETQSIRIVDLNNNRILKDLFSRSFSTSKNLMFTKDNKYLISTNYATKKYQDAIIDNLDKQGKLNLETMKTIPENIIMIWDINNNFELINILQIKEPRLNYINIFIKNNEYFLTGTNGRNIELINLNKGKTVKSIKANCLTLEYSTSNHHIACRSHPKTKIFNFNLDHIKTIENSMCKYSKDGNIFFCDEMPDTSFDVTKNYQKINSLNTALNQNNLVVDFSSNELEIINSKNRFDEYGMSKTVIKPSTVEFRKFIFENNIIKFEIQNPDIPYENIYKEFSLSKMILKNSNKESIKSNLNKDKISSNYKKDNYMKIYSNDKKYFVNYYNGYSNRAFFYEQDSKTKEYKEIGDREYITVSENSIWYRDKLIVASLGGNINIHNKEGVLLYSLVGHADTVKFMNISENILATYGEDNIVRLWDLKKLNFKHYNYLEFEKEIEQWIKKHNSTRSGVVTHLSNMRANNPIIGSLNKPLVNIFISKNDEFVIWTNEGFFDSSKKATKYIGYQISQRNNTLSKYVSVDKLYDTFYRPDLIQKALKGEDISSYAKGIDINTLINEGLAPDVRIVNTPTSTNKRDMTLQLEVCEYDGGGYDNLTLFLNGMAVDVIDKNRALKLQKQSKRRKECITIDKLISLQNGKNKIGFKATNGAGTIESNLDEIVVNYKGRSGGKPNLHILAIGVDKYRDGDLWLKYSKADAKEFTKSIKKVSKPLFKNIYTYKLLDKD
ncbi:MAG: WD40 repeat domain-containing protein, partial [Campylobacterota bacterium]|nr:WD40 repeat domain-containing protein [Campylobacterota bacterium]